MNTRTTAFGATQDPDDAWLAAAPEEPALDPDLSIIDTHMHLWHRPSGFRYFVEDYARDTAASRHRVEATIYVECRSMYRTDGPVPLRSVGETEFAAGMAAMAASGKYTSTRIAAGIVAHADPALGPAVAEVVDAHAAAAGGRLRGIRMGAKWDADPVVQDSAATRPGTYRNPAFHAGLLPIAERKLVFEVSIYHPQIDDVVVMARAMPDLQIVLIHSGSPVGFGSYAGEPARVHADWLAGMTELATCPNVSVKLGGILMTIANFDFDTAPAPPSSELLTDLWRPFLEPCIALFGVDRCMVESNFPVDKRGFPLGTVWNMFKRLTADYSADERTALFSGTAKRLYRL